MGPTNRGVCSASSLISKYTDTANVEMNPLLMPTYAKKRVSKFSDPITKSKNSKRFVDAVDFLVGGRKPSPFKNEQKYSRVF